MNLAVLPPVDFRAEQQILGDLLRGAPECQMIVRTLCKEAFADPVHAAVFGRIQQYVVRDRHPSLLVDDVEQGLDPHLANALHDVGSVYLQDLLLDRLPGRAFTEGSLDAMRRVAETWHDRIVWAGAQVGRA